MHGNTISLTGWGQKWYYGLSRTTLYTNSFKLDIAKVMERREGGGHFYQGDGSGSGHNTHSISDLT